MSYRVLQSLMNYLLTSQYVQFNPLKLLKLKSNYQTDVEDQKYQVWSRMLEADEWEALQQALNDLPEKTQKEIGDKIRTQFLFGLFYFLGLRVNEVAEHTWRAFQYKDEQWWFFVKGKGGKLGHIPVHHKLLKLAKIYRIHLGKTILPESNEEDPLIVSHQNKAIQKRQIYNIVKKMGLLASKIFPEEPHKAEKLKRLSPHWLRHLCASHQDKAGINLTMIKENMRHSSAQTTQIYMHGEDKERHNAIQKMNSKIDIELETPKEKTQQTIFKITLKKGPIHKALGFKMLIEALEEDVFKGLNCSRYDFNKQEKIGEIENSIIPVQKISFAYAFNNLEPNKKEEIKKEVVLEAKIRLFEAGSVIYD